MAHRLQLSIGLLDFYDDTESVVAQSNVSVKCVRVSNVQLDVWAVSSAQAKAEEAALLDDTDQEDGSHPPIPAKNDMNDAHGRASLVLLAAARLGADDVVRVTLFKGPQGEIAKTDIDVSLSQLRVVAQPWQISAILDASSVLSGRKRAVTLDELRSRRNQGMATSWTDMCGSLLMAMADEDVVDEGHWREHLRDRLQQLLDSESTKEHNTESEDQFLECNTGALVSAPVAPASPKEDDVSPEPDAAEARRMEINVQLNVHEISFTLPYTDLSSVHGDWTADTPVAVPHAGDQLIIALEGLNGGVELTKTGMRFDLETQELVISEALAHEGYVK